MNKESVIIYGFPGTGKTYAFNKAEELELDLQDSDSSHFHWLYKGEGFTDPVLDENGKKVVHPAWPANYAQYIELTGREQECPPDYIFVSTHKEVMEAVNNLGFVSFAVVPSKDCKDEFMRRFSERGSDEAFLKLMDEKFDEFVDSVVNFVLNDESANIFLVEIRPGGKIQSVYDLIKNRPGLEIPMEENND